MSIEDAYIELQKCNKLRQKTIIKLNKDNAKLKETLEKIKELIQYCQSATFCYECKYNSICMGKFNFIEHILSIIEGAEDE